MPCFHAPPPKQVTTGRVLRVKTWQGWVRASGRIVVQIEAGGRKLIQITDNGCGMVRDDALLAFERHATSKLSDVKDLLSIATLGFRDGGWGRLTAPHKAT